MKTEIRSQSEGSPDCIHHILSIDLGGTHAAYAVVSSTGEVSSRGSLDTADYNTFEELLEALSEVVGSSSFEAVAFCAPAVDSQGVIRGAVDLPWPSPIYLSELTSAKFGKPCVACNDANAAAMGEWMFGAARGMRDFIVLTLGTGIGAGVVCDGKLLLGHRGLAGELGHTLVRRGDAARPCTCGRRGCLETYCAARGVVMTAKELLAHLRDESSAVRSYPDGEITAKDVAEAALSGEEWALEAFRITGKILGEACADFAACFSPQAIILFGGVAKAGDVLLTPTRESFAKNLLWLYDGNTEVILSGLEGGDAALLGAAANAFNELCSHYTKLS